MTVPQTPPPPSSAAGPVASPVPRSAESAETVLITGAAGRIGTALRSRLARPGRTLRLLDVTAPPAPEPGEAVETLVGDITDPAALGSALAGADAVVHLGAHSGERPWREILDVNIHGTYVVLEAARAAGVSRAVLASSNHAAGFTPESVGEAGEYLYPRPDTFYGVSKAALEALGSLYHDRYGMDVVALRIGACFERPENPRELGMWLSFDDCARLVEASLSVPAPGFRLVWGISANTRRWWSLTEARALGYEPQDDSERYAAALIAEFGEPGPGDPGHGRLGGEFCGPEYDHGRG